MSEARYCEWIAVDWGTTHLRAWAMQGGVARGEASSDKGMGVLEPGGFEPALLELVEPWLGADRMEVLACGMVGARQGWIEAPYRAVPCAPAGPGAVAAPASDRRLDVRILPGLSQADPADVMRGEETQIAGFLAGEPGFDGVLCLPGTHTKWARISAGEVVGFRTFMTGEMFSLLSTASVLRHSVDGGWDEAAFAEAVEDAISRPEQMAGRFFALRAEGLLRGLAPGVARARLSGGLIGAELAATRPYWLGLDVAVIGGGAMARAYGAALDGQGAGVRLSDVSTLTRAGLVRARELAWETAT